jgi:transcriptional regulator with XRE-family HTH domain
VSLRGFVLELHRKEGLSQTKIAIRSGLSQGLIYKILAGIGIPQMRTYQKLAAAFPESWNAYLVGHPGFRKELAEAFGWARGPDLSVGRQPDNPLELFESLLGVNRAHDLPPEALERYRRKIREVMRRAARDLGDYRKALEADLRMGRRRPRVKPHPEQGQIGKQSRSHGRVKHGPRGALG